MKKKIIILGSTGMAGHMVFFYLKEKGCYDVQDIVFRTPLTSSSIAIDLTYREATKELILRLKPDIIINCVGVLIKGSKENPANAIYLNAYFPHQLSQIADEIGAKLIHISTDCVFSGKKGMYTENDFRDADDIYGRSKALGEISNLPHLTLRTSIVGPELKANGEGLFHWFMKQKGECYGYKTAFWSGVTTLELARVIDFSIQNDLSGLINVSNGIPINKNDLLNLFKEEFHKEIDIIPVEKNSVDKSMAKSDRLKYKIPSYRQMMEELKEWMTRHTELYAKNYDC